MWWTCGDTCRCWTGTCWALDEEPGLEPINYLVERQASKPDH